MGLKARTAACDAALADMVAYMRQDGVRVAVYDATNSTRDRRIHLLSVLDDEGIGAKRMFLEIICDNEEVRLKKRIMLNIISLCRVQALMYLSLYALPTIKPQAFRRKHSICQVIHP